MPRLSVNSSGTLKRKHESTESETENQPPAKRAASNKDHGQDAEVKGGEPLEFQRMPIFDIRTPQPVLRNDFKIGRVISIQDMAYVTLVPYCFLAVLSPLIVDKKMLTGGKHWSST